MKYEEAVVAYGSLNYTILLILVTGLANIKGMKEYKAEIMVIGIGTLTFMYVSWLVVFIAQINPFIKPTFN